MTTREPFVRHSFSQVEKRARFASISMKSPTAKSPMSQLSKAPRKSSGASPPSQPSLIQDVGVLVFARFDCNANVIGRDVVSDCSRLVFGSAEKNLNALQIPQRRLCVDVEFAKGFDFVSKIFGANRTWRLPRKQIENATAHGELPARRDLRRSLVPGRDE